MTAKNNRDVNGWFVESPKQTDTSQLAGCDWNGFDRMFHCDDRVLFHDDDGSMYKGRITRCSDRSLHINFDDGDEGWEPTEQCEILSE
jgi:hypothetical protein